MRVCLYQGICLKCTIRYLPDNKFIICFSTSTVYIWMPFTIIGSLYTISMVCLQDVYICQIATYKLNHYNIIETL